MLQKVYKVVQVENGGLFSAGNPSNKYRLRYIENKIIVPLIGKIFCFSGIDTAKDFVYEMTKYGGDTRFQIWSAIGNDPQECTGIAYSVLNIFKFWNDDSPKNPAPVGTMLVDSIVLLDKVYG